MRTLADMSPNTGDTPIASSDLISDIPVRLPRHAGVADPSRGDGQGSQRGSRRLSENRSVAEARSAPLTARTWTPTLGGSCSLWAACSCRPEGRRKNYRSSVVDLERLIEGHLKTDFDQYADLPEDVLGQTDFRAARKPFVQINKDLTGVFDSDDCPAGIEGRWRATVAHETAHIILHRMLFEVDDAQIRLFPAEDSPAPAQQLHRCLKRDSRTGRPRLIGERSKPIRAWPPCSCRNRSSVEQRAGSAPDQPPAHR